MTIVKIKIDHKEFEIECGEGEEKFLHEAVIKINKIIKDSSEIKKLPESKKFLMISLILAEEGIRVSKINEESRNNFDNIDIELKKLESLIDAKK